MICVDYPCDSCIHRRGKVDGWKCACDAFPDGIPVDFMFMLDPSKQKECNNGIGYVHDENSIFPLGGSNK